MASQPDDGNFWKKWIDEHIFQSPDDFDDLGTATLDLPDWDDLAGLRHDPWSPAANLANTQGNEVSWENLNPIDDLFGYLPPNIASSNNTGIDASDQQAGFSPLFMDDILNLGDGNGCRMDFGEDVTSFAQFLDDDAAERIAMIASGLQSSMSQVGRRAAARLVLDTIRNRPNPTMQMRTQPKPNYRFRYRSEKLRFIEGSQKDFTTIQLPELEGCLMTGEQSLCIQVTIVTTNDNPQRKHFIHPNHLESHESGAIQNGPSSFRVPVTEAETHHRIKSIRSTAMFKRLAKDYSFQLVPYEPSAPDSQVETYTHPDEHRVAPGKKAKAFDAAYHTDQYQLVFELLIKVGEEFLPTGISCQTHVVSDTR